MLPHNCPLLSMNSINRIPSMLPILKKQMFFKFHTCGQAHVLFRCQITLSVSEPSPFNSSIHLGYDVEAGIIGHISSWMELNY